MRTRYKWGTVAALAAAIGAGAYLVWGSANASETIPSSQQAHSLVEDVYNATVDRDRKGVCAQRASAANCRLLLDEVEGVWPTGPAKVMCERRIAPEGDRSGGYALRLEGMDTAGHAYTTDVLAIGTADGPKLMNVVFWRSAGIGAGSTTEESLDVCAA